MKECKRCGNLHNQESSLYCSQKCAKSRVWSKEDKLKKSLANKNNIPWNKRNR